MAGVTVGGPGFNQTKKNLPTLNKINGGGGGASSVISGASGGAAHGQKKSYVSPYSFKAI